MTQTIIKVPATGGSAFDPTDIEITDNTSGAFLVKEGSNEYIRIDTTNGAEKMVLKGRPTSASGAQLYLDDAPFIQGTNNNNVQVPSFGVQIVAGVANNRIINKLGSSNNYFQIQDSSTAILKIEEDTNATYTLNDSNSAVFKVQDDAGTPVELLKIDSTIGARRAELKTGHSNQYVVLNQSGDYAQFRNGSFNQVYLTGNDTMELYGKFLSHRQFSGGFFRTMNAANTIQLFAVEENSNTTFRLNTATPGVFKVQDHGTTQDYLKIDSTGNGDFEAKCATYDFKDHNNYRVFEYIATNSWSFGTSHSSGPGAYSGVGDELRISCLRSGGTTINNKMRARGAGSGDKFRVSSNTEVNLEIDQDSNTTFTLDSGTTCNFKVVDDAGSPITYIDVERGLTERVKIPVVGLQHIRAIGGNFVAGISNTTGINLNTYPLNYAGTVYEYDQSDDGTSKSIGVKPSYVVKYSSAASGAATTGITLELNAPVPADGTISPQYLVLQNQNATHSAKFIVDPTGFYAGKEVATSGTDAADLIGSGFTLAAGKFAIFSILACRVANTGSHYFYAVSLHTKT